MRHKSHSDAALVPVALCLKSKATCPAGTVFAAHCPQSLITFDIIGTERWSAAAAPSVSNVCTQTHIYIWRRREEDEHAK